jgi:hypothetical protein
MMAVEHPVSRRVAMALGVLSFMPHVTSAEEEKPLVPGHWPMHVSKFVFIIFFMYIHFAEVIFLHLNHVHSFC